MNHFDTIHNDSDSQEKSINIKSYLQGMAKIWYYFPISLLICVSIGYYISIYTPRTYKATATILIKKDSKGGADDFMQGFGLFNSQQSTENEIGILKTFDLAEATIKSSNHFIHYYEQKRARKDNIYTQAPFIVTMDPFHPQLIGMYRLEYNKDNTLEISIEKDRKLIYDFNNYRNISIEESSKKFSKTCKMGEWIETPWLKIRIDARPNTVFETKKNTTFYFEINDVNSLAQSLNKSVTAEPAGKQSDIIHISLTFNNKEEGVDLLSEFINQYNLSNLNDKNQMAITTIDFIDSQLEVLSDTLSSTEYKLESFRRDNKVINVELQAQGVYEQSQKIATDIALSELHLKYFKYLEDYLQTHNEFQDILVPSVMGVSDPFLNRLITDLFELSTTKNKLMASSTDTNPLVTNINKQIAESKKAVSEAIQSLTNSKKIEISELKRNLLSFDKELMLIPEKERSLINIQRNFKINNDIYTFLLQKRAESAIARASNMPDSRIIDNARPISLNPITPNKKLIYIISLLLGLLIPVGFVIIKKMLYDFIDSKEDLQSITNIPVISSIPHSELDSTTVVHDFPKSEITEAFRGLRTKMQFVLDPIESNVILVTSSIPNEGKTFLSINIAISYAINDKKTIILGMDLRNPSLSKEMSILNSGNYLKQTGISTILSGQSSLSDAIHKTEIPNLDYISAGPIPPNPSELIGNLRMGEMIEELKKTYDFIILDTPPINVVSDALQLFKYTNSILYVVRLNFTQKKFLEEIQHFHNGNPSANIGIILNDDTTSDGYYYHSYYYNSPKKKSFIQRILNKKK
ncbi:MAG: polysaccharide biosynthesis tyrosine autokinase [Dysgonamonadaceae bacterium]|nr:polysaccharide biosynthesis tyrosine autokinase [Dysgonamonadaceae bacterium]